MKISTREDISVPIEDVFAAVSDFGAIERLFQRRGIVIERD
ncbi:MAG: SRPBCC family protein, partial [Silicimonas sp.]|nr:SRPBCC family protein [Silicimonas sp.]